MSNVINGDLFHDSYLNNQTHNIHSSFIQNQRQKQQNNQTFYHNTIQKILKSINYYGKIYHQKQPKSTNHIECYLLTPLNSILNYFILSQIIIDFQGKSIKISSKILNQYHKIVNLNSKHQRILTNKIVSKHQSNHQSKITINLYNGQLKFTRFELKFHQNHSTTQNQAHIIIPMIHQNIKKTLLESVKIFQKLIKLNPSLKNSSINELNIFPQYNQILRHIHRSSIEPVFQISLGSSKYQKIQNLQNNSQQQIKNILSHIDFKQTQFRSVSLYQTQQISSVSMKNTYNQHYFQLNILEQQVLKQKIQQFSRLKKSSKENKFVCNIIELYQPSQIKLKKINSGGFSKIYKSQVQFWYLMSLGNQRFEIFQNLPKNAQNKYQNVKNNEKLLLKQVEKAYTIKKMIQKSLIFKKQINEKNSIRHQQQIVFKFKSLSSIFLPQYYRIFRSQQLFEEYLLVEYLPFPTLSQYIRINQNSLSFLTKIHLILMITKGLQGIKDCNVTHLDLKPSNLMVAKGLIVKIIDFGNSYCRQTQSVKEGKFKPAFTIPYGCPQIIGFNHIKRDKFSEKSDIYSWSIILFQLLFERLPFYFSSIKKVNQKYLNRQPKQYLFYVPQQEQKYGLVQTSHYEKHIKRPIEKTILQLDCYHCQRVLKST